MADFVDDHHGQLHLIGWRRHLGVQQDLLLHEDAQPPVLHGGVGMFGHCQQIWKKTTQSNMLMLVNRRWMLSLINKLPVSFIHWDSTIKIKRSLWQNDCWHQSTSHFGLKLNPWVILTTCQRSLLSPQHGYTESSDVFLHISEWERQRDMEETRIRPEEEGVCLLWGRFFRVERKWLNVSKGGLTSLDKQSSRSESHPVKG